MAINDKNVPLMRDYLGQFKKRSIATVVGASVSVALFITCILSLSHLMPPWSIAFWATFLIVTVSTSCINIWLFYRITRPFSDLVNEIVMINGEPHGTPPPNPNTRHYDEDGFREILQVVYELASKNDTPVITPDAVDDILTEGLNSTSTGIIILDADQEIVYYNKKAPIRVNSNNEKMIDILFNDSDSLSKWIADCAENSIHNERIWTRVANKTPGEHGRRIYDIVGSYNKNSRAETVLTFFDRTSMYVPEEDDLDFIAFAAHELRGPITVIRGYLDVLEEELEPSLKKEQGELFQRLTVSANRLSSYVNNILNASRYDRRHFTVSLHEEHLNDIYESISTDMKLRAMAQNRLLSVEIPQDLPTIAADKNSIGEVLSNLIDNAIKYSNEGGQIVVSAKQVGQFVEIKVLDHGIGMPANVLPNLFHKFYRSHRSRETVAGTGIGLYISKAIIESHGGTIEVRSTESEGSTFTFTVPTYISVADKIKASHNSSTVLIAHGGGWIKNHSMFRG